MAGETAPPGATTPTHAPPPLHSEDAAAYEAALAKLGSLITGRSRKDGHSWEWNHAMEVMQLCLERLHMTEAVAGMRVIHVTGTKGKGSTCAFVESILRAAGYRTGLFTSPHLWDVRERIRIDGRPVARTPFIRALDSTFDTLAAAADNRVGVPAYFKFLTLLGLRCFLDAGVDVAILEVGIGGRLDATNVCPPPVVAGIAPLGFDHMDLLGDTLPAIATQKAGIFKPGSRAFTVPQRVDAAETLAERAAAVNIPLSLAASLADYKAPGGGPGDALPLGLRGAHQATNASLAVALAGAFDGWAAAHPGSLPSGAAPPGAADRAAALARGELPAEYAAGLATCAWHGRAEVVHDPASPPSALSFYLDGAHTPESMETCAHWFASECGKGVGGAGGAASPAAAAAVSPPSSPSSPDSELRLLLFNCMHERDPRRLLTPLTDTLRARGAPLAGAVFVPPDSSYASLGPAEEAKVDLSWQASLQAVWADLAASAGRAGGAGGAGGAAAAAAVGPPLRLPLLPPSPPRAAAAAVAASTAAKAASAAAQHQDAAVGAVSPSVTSAIEWLRSASRARPGVRLRVLVTGSLYLVGDVLRHLGRAEEGGE